MILEKSLGGAAWGWVSLKKLSAKGTTRWIEEHAFTLY